MMATWNKLNGRKTYISIAIWLIAHILADLNVIPSEQVEFWMKLGAEAGILAGITHKASKRG
jgi:hypothetical protein